MTAAQAYAYAKTILSEIIITGLLVLIAAAIAARLGLSQRIIPVMSPTELAYLAGAVWLFRRAG